MKIAAITHFKIGAIYQVLQQLGWTQAELARRCGATATEVGAALNMKRRPTAKLCDKMQKAFAEVGVYIDVLKIWPDSFLPFKRRPVIRQIQDVEPMQLEAMRQHEVALLEDSQEPVPGTLREMHELYVLLELAELDERERKVIDLYLKGETFDKISRQIPRLNPYRDRRGKHLLHRQTIEQIFQKALKKLKRTEQRVSMLEGIHTVKAEERTP